MQNYYEELSLPLGSTIEEVKSQFRKLAHQYHPDKNPNNTEKNAKYLRIQAAYKFLSSPEKKKEYDTKIYLYILSQREKRSSGNKKVYNRYSYASQKRTHPQVFWVKRNKKHSKEDHKKNIQGILYAVGFSILVGLIVSAILNYIEWKTKKEIQKLNTQLVAYQIDVSKDYIEKRFYVGLNKLDTLLNNPKYKIIRKERLKLRDIQLSFFSSIQEHAIQSINDKKFSLALNYLQLLIQFRDDNSYQTYKLIAIASKEAGHYLDAITSWQYIEKELGLSNFETASQIGLLYTYYVQNYNKGLEALLRARKYAINLYRKIFGNGYAIAFNSNKVPNVEQHFNVFYALALCYYHLDITEKALNMLTWVRRIDKNRSEYFLLKGLVVRRKEDITNIKRKKMSCYYLLKAKRLGNKQANFYIKQYCP